MNLKIITPTRKRPKTGDIFIFKMTATTWHFGRVIRADAKMGPFKGAVLVYLYRTISYAEHPLPDLKLEDLLMPPLIVDVGLWTKGYFKTVTSQDLADGDVLKHHIFRNRMNKKLFDELGNQLVVSEGPVGDYALLNYSAVNRLLCDALEKD